MKRPAGQYRALFTPLGVLDNILESRFFVDYSTHIISLSLTHTNII